MNAAGFSQNLHSFLAAHLSDAARSAAFAAYTRTTIRNLVAENRFPPVHTIYVDGKKNGIPEEVKPDGTIIYEGNSLAAAIEFALDALQKLSPVGRSARYKASWHVLVNGAPWDSTNYTTIPSDAVVTLTNTMPYHRKIDMGSQNRSGRPMKISSGHRNYKGTKARAGVYTSLTEEVRRATMRRFQELTAERAFVPLPGGPAPAPYRLRGDYVSNRYFPQEDLKNVARRLKSKVRHLPGAKYSREGEMMTYPAVLLYLGRAR